MAGRVGSGHRVKNPDPVPSLVQSQVIVLCGKLLRITALNSGYLIIFCCIGVLMFRKRNTG